MEIARTGNMELINNNSEAWEEIVRRNCIANEVHEYKNYIDAMRSLALLSNKYIAIKAHVDRLSIPVFGGGEISGDSVLYLNSIGIEVDTTSKESYVASLLAALKKRENMMTRINMQRKELEKIITQTKVTEEKGIEQILAVLSYNIGFPIGDNVTLARFNEYNKLVKVQQSELKRNGRNK